MLIAAFDLATGETTYHATGDGTTNISDYEMYYEVPSGYAMTGLCLREKDNNLKNMKVYYQAIDEEDSSNAYLDPDQTIAWEGDALSEYEVEYIPETNNQYVITGIVVNSSSKHGGFNILVCKIAKLTVTYGISSSSKTESTSSSLEGVRKNNSGTPANPGLDG